MIFNIPIPDELKSVVKVITVASDGSVFIGYAEERALVEVSGEHGLIVVPKQSIGRQLRLNVIGRGE